MYEIRTLNQFFTTITTNMQHRIKQHKTQVHTLNKFKWSILETIIKSSEIIIINDLGNFHEIIKSSYQVY